ncbi:MAG: TetR/AcrR family transcriptional regulator [Pseudomonadota bacterium]
MSTKDRILDAAEHHVRAGGYQAFSFRDIAEEIGIKSASVHHHYPTKAALMTQLALRYREDFLAALPSLEPSQSPAPILQHAFRQALHQDGLMCLCGSLAAQSDILPEAVGRETRSFFQALTDYASDGYQGLVPEPEEAAVALISLLEGAMMMAKIQGDFALFDRATHHLLAQN